MTTELGEWLIVAFTFVVAGSTVAYAILTWKLVAETRTMREVQTEPRVSARLELAQSLDHRAVELVIRNEGQGQAHKIKFSFEDDLAPFIERGHRGPLDEIPAFKNGLPNMAPGQQFRFFLGWLVSDEVKNATSPLRSIGVYYKNLSGKSLRDEYTLDFSQFFGVLIEQDYLQRIADHLNVIQQDIHLVAQGLTSLRVVTQTKQELQRLREERHIEPTDGTQTAAEVPKSVDDDDNGNGD